MNIADKKAFASEFYSRQTAMKELGLKGQRKLAKSKVAIVGVGGLGTVSSLYLALAGVGHLRLTDKSYTPRMTCITRRRKSPRSNS
jgi:molybdopterin/thiamine biosynthesis adenylyltransferase